MHSPCKQICILFIAEIRSEKKRKSMSSASTITSSTTAQSSYPVLQVAKQPSPSLSQPSPAPEPSPSAPQPSPSAPQPAPSAPEPSPQQPNDIDQCPSCFLTPCIVQQVQGVGWIGPGQGPSHHNSGIRKTLYRRFWHSIANCGGWMLRQYLDRKTQAAGTPAAVMHRREVMPQCVLTFCRDLYPNPKDKPYMGHMWE